MRKPKTLPSPGVLRANAAPRWASTTYLTSASPSPRLSTPRGALSELWANAFPNRGQLLGGNPEPAVLDREHDLSLDRLAADPHEPALAVELDRVVHQVVDGLADLLPVDAHGRQRLGDVVEHRHAAGCAELLQRRDDALD